MELLKVAGIEKNFGATKALDEVSLSVTEGSIHSLLGRNGAGKSTLVGIIAGTLAADRGKVFFAGEDISHLTVAERQALGIRIVTQQAAVIPELDVAENIFVGLWPRKKAKFIDFSKMYASASKELTRYGLNLSVRAKMKTLSAVDQRKVNIVRALFGGGKLVILDEPTTSLSHDDRENLFRFIGKQTDTKCSFIFISHYLNEVARISDHITVIRDGKSFTGYQKGSVSEQRLTELVVGEDVALTRRKKVSAFEDCILRCQKVCGKNMDEISFSLRKGEILGIVGFPGSGARSIARALFGLIPTTRGTMEIEQREMKLMSPELALQSGLTYVPNDRHAEGVVGTLSIRENINLSILKTALRKKGGFVDEKKERETALHYKKKLSIKANTIEDRLHALSGGNQQKVVVSKVLSARPKVLILDEPTIGIDIKSREEILELVLEISSHGVGVIYLTNDFDELSRISDRFLFFRKGKITHEIINEDLSPEEIINIRDNYITRCPQ